jgi:Bacterial PH domain
MKYVDTILEPGETLRYRTSVSRMVYQWPALITIFIGWIFFQSNDWGNPAFDRLACAGFAFCAFILFRTWLKRLRTEIAVTDRRIIYKVGIGRRSTEELNMDAIARVCLRQSFVGRWFDFGVVEVDGAVWSESFLVDSPLALRASMTRSGGDHA